LFSQNSVSSLHNGFARRLSKFSVILTYSLFIMFHNKSFRSSCVFLVSNFRGVSKMVHCSYMPSQAAEATFRSDFSILMIKLNASLKSMHTQEKA